MQSWDCPLQIWISVGWHPPPPRKTKTKKKKKKNKTTATNKKIKQHFQCNFGEGGINPQCFHTRNKTKNTKFVFLLEEKQNNLNISAVTVIPDNAFFDPVTFCLRSGV